MPPDPKPRSAPLGDPAAIDPTLRLPHAGAMVFIDSVDSFDGESIRCRARVRPDNPLAVDGRLETVAALEFLAQAAGLLLGLIAEAAAEPDAAGSPRPGGLLVRAPELGFSLPHFAVGDELLIEVTHQGAEGPLEAFSGAVHRAGAELMRGSFRVLRSPSGAAR